MLFVVACCVLVVVCCSLLGVRCLLFVVVCCMLCVDGRFPRLVVVCRLLLCCLVVC